MRVLLPPSETKRQEGGKSRLNDQNLAFADELGKGRQLVETALVSLSRDLTVAQKSLKATGRASAEIANNLTLRTQFALPAIERYTGVLYDSIDFSSLPAESKEWITTHVYVQSALFGTISAGDLIPAYRVQASSSIASLGCSLKKHWQQSHKHVSFKDALVLDMRSKDYVALAPHKNALYVEVYTLGADGQARALNHFNKATKGKLVKLLAKQQASFDSAADLSRWLKTQNVHNELLDGVLRVYA